MAWQCRRCNHWTADNEHNSCINDEVDELRMRVRELEGLVTKQKDDLDGRMERNGLYIAENENLRDALRRARDQLKLYKADYSVKKCNEALGET